MKGEKGKRGKGEKGKRGKGEKGKRGKGEKGKRGKGEKGKRGKGEKGKRGAFSWMFGDYTGNRSGPLTVGSAVGPVPSCANAEI